MENDLYDYLIELFTSVIQKDKAALEKLEASGFLVNDNHWQFTLPKLFDFIKAREPTFDTLTYPLFRKELFNSPVNQTLAKYKGKIIIIENRQKVDQTLYALHFTSN